MGFRPRQSVLWVWVLSAILASGCIAPFLPKGAGWEVTKAVLTGPSGPVILRGIGWSPWHPETGWGRSEETKQTDLRLLKEAHVNCLRTWGVVEPKSADYWQENGFLLVTQVGGNWLKSGKDVPHTRFRDGKPSTQPNYADPKVVAAFQAACREYAAKTGASANVVLSLLGNEFSWVGKDDTGSYAYAGFDEVTLAGFRQHLTRRFGDVQTMNKLCGTSFSGFGEVVPPSGGRLQYEWWIFLRSAFEEFMRAGNSALKAAAPYRPTSYAKLMGRWDPCCEDAPLGFLSVGGQNLYWHWDKDWARYCVLLKELIRHAGGRPVVITESGFQTWLDPVKEQEAARRMKQMLWNCFMHPEVAGVFPYLYNDEWWCDGDPKTQSPGETWGVVTAHRKPKKTYAALAEVYGEVEKLEKFLLGAESPPTVALSCQDLDWVLAKEDGTARVVEAARALYAKGVAFRIVNSEDLLRPCPDKTPFLILCDSVLLRSPDGREDASRALLSYVERGGRVLYLSPTPFRVAYGEANVPHGLHLWWTRRQGGEFRWGQGAIRFVGEKTITSAQAWPHIQRFLAEALRAQTVAEVATQPAGQEFGVFLSVLQAGDRKVLVVVNEQEQGIGQVTIRLNAALSGWRATLEASDGAAMTEATVGGSRTLTIRGLETHAIVGLDK